MGKVLFTIYLYVRIISVVYLTLSFQPLIAKEQHTFFLNQDEEKWLNNLSAPLKVGITTIPNQVLTDKKSQFKGFSVDLFQKIETLLNIKFKFIYYETWNELMEAAENKKVDIVFSAQKTQDRLAHFDFTDVVLSQQNKIIVRSSHKGNMTIDDLFGKTVAIAKGSALADYLRYNYPKIVLVASKDEKESLFMVTQKSVDATISEAVRASYYMEENNIKNMRVAGDLGYNYNLRICNRNDLPMLSIVLSKAVDKIPREQLESLQFKWGYTKDKINYFDTQTLIYIAILFGIILPLLIYLYIVNRRFKKAIDKLHVAKDEIHALKVLAEDEARTDALTNIANKRKIQELLYHYIEEYKRTDIIFSLIMIDIDYFKNVNDTMGHDIGDKVLIGFAQLIKKTLRPYDHCGRIGGEEFVMILPNTRLKEAIGIADRLRMTIKNHSYHLDKHIFSITSSLGVTEVQAQDSPLSIMQRADKMLYKSKKSGRNCVNDI